MPKSIEFVKDLDKIIILAQGPSWYQCPEKVPENVEIWGSNVIYRDHPHQDRLFFGHDIRQNILDDDMDLISNLNKMEIPVYTTGVYRVLSKSAQIPILEILEEFHKGFLLNVIAYMIAIAILQRPKSIDLYGVDMRPDAGQESYVNEKGCVEFWCGVAIGRGIPVKNTLESYVMKIKQEAAFPNFKKKVEQKGLYTLVPEEHRNPMGMQNYVVMPVGDEI
jgi:hypothetical protein